MAHGLEARVLFLDLDLDLDMLALTSRSRSSGASAGNSVRRKRSSEAIAGWPPDDLLWRVKEQFGDGSGTVDVMRTRIEEVESEADWASIRVAELPAPRSREELAYQRVFAAALPAVRAGVIGRFATA